MHRMRISTDKVSSEKFRLNKLEIWEKRIVPVKEQDKKNDSAKLSQIRRRIRAMNEGDRFYRKTKTK
jgi:hypothetical protein